MDKCNPSGYKCSTLEHHSKERKTMISIPPSYEELRPQFMAFLSSEQNVLHLQTGNNWTTYVKVPCLEHSVAIFKGNGGRHSQFPNLLCPVGEDESLGFKGLYNKETGILFDAFHLFIDFGCEHINIKAIEEDYKKQATAALLDHLLKHEDSFGDGIPDANNADFRAPGGLYRREERGAILAPIHK